MICDELVIKTNNDSLADQNLIFDPSFENDQPNVGVVICVYPSQRYCRMTERFTIIPAKKISIFY